MISTAASGVFAPFPSQRNSVAFLKRAAKSLRAPLHSKSCRSPFSIPRAPWRPDWNSVFKKVQIFITRILPLFRVLAPLPAAAIAVIAFAAPAAAAPTTYPLDITNCGRTVRFDKAPQKVVSIGQGMTEILFSLGLAGKIAGTAVWVGPVLPAFAETNKGIKRLADKDPSFESVVGAEPDLVAAEFEWHVGAQGSVGKREQFSGLKTGQVNIHDMESR